MIVELIKLGAVGIISGIFSAYIATRGHRDMKWWELRVAAYQSVIEALSDLTHYYDSKYKAEVESRELSDEYEEELGRFWKDGYHKVRKAADSGVFLFSEDVNRALKEFMDLKNQNHQSYWEHLDSNLAIAEKCLKTVVKSAKNDLRINNSALL